MKSRLSRILSRAKLFHLVKYSLIIVLLPMALSFMPLAPAFSTVNTAKAQNWSDIVGQGGLNQVGEAYGNNTTDIRMIVVDIIKIVLGFLGIIATVIILFAGFKWMTAGGNEENVTTAKKLLINSVIGLVIIISAYALAFFVINKIVETVNTTPAK